MIVVTGAAGFIASVVAHKLIAEGFDRLVLVDDFSRIRKEPNYTGLKNVQLVDRDTFTDWMVKNGSQVDFIIHLGARTDTAEFDMTVFEKLNISYSKSIWKICCDQNIPLIYASSAATYGLGEFGYVDDHEIVEHLKPLNPYGVSKNEFDKWVLKQDKQPPFWAGLKFFNVYGPNEYHKDRMASVVYHAFNQIVRTDKVKLFRSHRSDFGDGQQLRDFIYVKDIARVILFLMDAKPVNGLYNLGTGQARSFLDLATATFKAMRKTPDIEFIDTPEDIRDTYQYFTEADMHKLRSAGYRNSFTALEEGIGDYVANYLSVSKNLHVF